MPLSRDNTEDPGVGSSDSDGVTITNSPKPDGQFDFQKFLDQMKTKGADPIAKYLRRWASRFTICNWRMMVSHLSPLIISSFLSNFAKKTFAVNDQIKIIHDFLDVGFLLLCR